MSIKRMVSKKIIPYSATQGRKLEKRLGNVERDVKILKDDVSILKYDMNIVKHDVGDMKETMTDNHNAVMNRLDQMVGLMTKRDIEQAAHTQWLKRHDVVIEKITTHIGLKLPNELI